MKKVFLLAGCLSLLIVGIVNVSCSKEEWKGCTCTVTNAGNQNGTKSFSASQIRDVDPNVNTCNELQIGLRSSLRDSGYSSANVSCKDL